MNSREKFTLILFLLAVFGLAHAINPHSASCSRCAYGYTLCRLPSAF